MTPSQIAENLLHTISQLSGFPAYATIVGVLFICGLGIPIPEDITLLAAGLLASTERITLVGALIAGFVGVMIGDALLFFLGRKFGKKVFGLPGLRNFLTPERVAAAEARIRKNGPFICFIARFLPGVRSAVFAMAGALGVRPATFFLLDGFAAALSVPLWVCLGWWLGNTFEDAFDVALEEAKSVQLYVLGGLAAVIAIYVMIKLIKKKRANSAARL
jgi:membrane protein DedA with SNARE-associated domain